MTDIPRSPWTNKTLGVIGAGNMGEALIRGAIDGGAVSPERIVVYDPLPEREAVLAGQGCRIAADVRHAAGCDAVLLAVKPQIIRTAILEAAAAMTPETLVISIAAGVTTRFLESTLPPGIKVVRAMPNTPLMVGMGMSAIARGKNAGDEEMSLALALFAGSGKAAAVAEDLLDAVTALSGSGPAYLFRFAEALIAGGEAMGLGPELARTLTEHTLRGAAEMLVRDHDPAGLRERVTSPGGTTAAALAVLDDRGFADLVRDALFAAKRRGGELGSQMEEACPGINALRPK